LLKCFYKEFPKNPTMNYESVHFSPEELSRYNRHIILPHFGLEGQQKLKAARVLVVGAGGLGSPLLLYLAAAGVGTIGIIDFDVVNDSNLQRQVLFGVDDITHFKVSAAKRRLLELNPYIDIITYNTPLTSANALDIIKEYDTVADGSDNFPTRYLVNDACVLTGKPYVYASIFQFEGQVAVFNFTDKQGETGPNYRDLYPSPPPPGAVQDCGVAGVLGVLPGIIGTFQAMEVIKLITGTGEILSGRYFIFDALSFETKIFKIKRSEDNPLNGSHPSVTSLIDYELFCGVERELKPIKEINYHELEDLQLKNAPLQLIDVREQDEYNLVNIGAELMPLSDIISHEAAISRDKKVVIHCMTGSRSTKAIKMLEEKFGFTNLYNLKGGIVAYINELRPELKKW
jgi:molybdopterin/thiamine biosynthesis adenylyltransferase/rhodanese-related sulfurtransferase